tara:strand:- start:382 stop:573 length:192 start_codon:yes stop_codon:yes gene_type:complete
MVIPKLEQALQLGSAGVIPAPAHSSLVPPHGEIGVTELGGIQTWPVVQALAQLLGLLARTSTM